MSYPRIVNAVFNSPWAIQRPFLGSIFTLLHSAVFAGEQAPVPRRGAASETEILASLRAGSTARPGRGSFAVERWGVNAAGALVCLSDQVHASALAAYYQAGGYEGGGVAAYQQTAASATAALPAGQTVVLFGSGVLGKHLSEMEEACAGGLSVDRLQAALAEARDDDKVSAVVLHLDSPGGVVYGIPETAALVRSIREQKHCVAYCDSLSASAAYWITAACDYFYVTPSAEVGSIGVYSAVVDYSEWCTKQGIKVDLIKDGTFKGAGFPGTSLTEEQRAKIQTDVLACSAAFKADVRSFRGAAVADDTMQGQCHSAPEAVRLGLADAIVPDLAAVLVDLAQAPAAGE
jgi:signal peptide peptidase SppA